MTKAELRKQYLNERLSLSDGDFEELNNHLCNNFFSSLHFENVRVVHSFIPMLNTREPDTWRIINRIRTMYPEIKISVPRINVNTKEVDNFYFEGKSQMKPNPWGIPEPEFGEATRTEEIDMVLAPLLVADRMGHRVGYGKGFYDKFLAKCKPSCITVGLCLFEPVKKIDDVGTHDVALKYCVTPAKVHRFA